MEESYDIFLPVYSYTVRVIVTPDVLASRNSKKSVFGCTYNAKVYVRALCAAVSKESLCYIFINPKEDVGTIAHESYHAVCYLLSYIGATHDEEIVAYHLDYLTRLIHKMCHPTTTNSE